MSHALSALQLVHHGLRPHVLAINSKRPMATAWQSEVDYSAEAVRERFESAPEGHGIGIRTGDGLVVLDVDGAEGQAAFAQLQTQLGILPPTVSAATPSGGQHHYFRVGVPVKNSVSKLAPKVDVRGDGGQVVCAPTTIDGKPYSWVQSPGEVDIAVLPAPWLLAIIGEPTQAPAPKPAPSSQLRSSHDRDFAKKRAALYLAKCPPSIAGEGGHNALFSAACRAVELCLDEADVLDVLREFNERCQPAWEEHELVRKVREARKFHQLGEKFDPPVVAAPAAAPAPSTPAAPAAPAQVNAQVVYVEEMQSWVARTRDRQTWNLANPLSKEAARIVLVSSGMAPAAATTALTNSGQAGGPVPCAKYVDCNPDQPSMFTDDDGFIVLNNYVPPVIKPVPGSFPVISEVLDFLTCGDERARAWLWNWMAFAVKYPARMLRTAPIVYGEQGTGKSLLARTMRELVGNYNSANIRNDDIQSRFNVSYATKLLVTVGEIEASEIPHATARLKYLTGDDELTIEAKGVSAFSAKNRIKLLCTSNKTLPVLVEGDRDTRWCLFQQLTPPSADYTRRMDSLFDSQNRWSEKGQAEVAALLAALLDHEVDDALAKMVFRNDAREKAVEASRGSVEQFIELVKTSSLDAVWVEYVPGHERNSPAFAHMDIARRPELTGAQALYTTYRFFCRATGLQALGNTRFPVELERYAPGWTRSKMGGSSVASRPHVYANVPRNAQLRIEYVPLSIRQALPETPGDHPEAQRVREVFQQEFGLDVVEEGDES